MSTFTAQQKKDLQPLARRVAQMNAALDDVNESCTCYTGKPCPVAGKDPACRSTVVAAIRVQMNLIRLAHNHLDDLDLIDAVRALGRLFAGMAGATSHVAFANEILLALRGEPAFDEVSGKRRVKS